MSEPTGYHQKYLKYLQRYYRLLAGSNVMGTPFIRLQRLPRIPHENERAEELLEQFYRTPVQEQTDDWRNHLIQDEIPEFVGKVRTETGMLTMISLLRQLVPALTDLEFSTVRDSFQYLYHHPCGEPCNSHHRQVLLNQKSPFGLPSSKKNTLREQQRLAREDISRQQESGVCDRCQSWQRRIGDQVWTQKVAQEYGRLLRERHPVQHLVRALEDSADRLDSQGRLQVSPIQDVARSQQQQNMELSIQNLEEQISRLQQRLHTLPVSRAELRWFDRRTMNLRHAITSLESRLDQSRGISSTTAEGEEGLGDAQSVVRRLEQHLVEQQRQEQHRVVSEEDHDEVKESDLTFQSSEL